MKKESEERSELSELEHFNIIIADERVCGGRMLPLMTAKEYLEKNVHKIKWAETVLEYGREFKIPTEKQVRQMYEHWRKNKFPFENGRCYRNSYVFGKIGDGPYVEGLAMTVPRRALFHAWNVFPGSSVVADVTWPLACYFTSYMGIEFPVDFFFSLLEELEEKNKKTGENLCSKGGIFYSWHLFEEPVREFLRTRRTNSST